jgi:hypothetical protein
MWWKAAFSWLERGLATGAVGVFYKDEPVWDPIRSDSRFAALLEKISRPAQTFGGHDKLTQLLLRTQAAQRLQSRSRVCGGGVAADSNRHAGISVFRNSELGRSADRAGNDRWISHRADHRMGL